MNAARVMRVALSAAALVVAGCAGADGAPRGGTALSSTTWSEGDPSALYPYAAAYFYVGTTTLEIEFSATPASEPTGRRIVLICRPDLRGDGEVTTELCGWAQIRTEPHCSEASATATLPAILPVTTSDGPWRVSGHVGGLEFPGLGTLAVDLDALPIVSGGARVCADGV